MSTHFHWIILIDNKKGTISDIMRDIMEKLKLNNELDILRLLKEEGKLYKNHKRKF
jgi:hypothetical protein